MAAEPPLAPEMLHLWASVSSGWAEDAAAELRALPAVLRVSAQTGVVRFDVSCDAFAALAPALRALRFADFLHATIAAADLGQGGKKKKRLRHAVEPLDFNEKAEVSAAATAAPARLASVPSGTAGLERVAEVARDVVGADAVRRAVRAWREYNDEAEGDNGGVEEAPPLDFRVIAKRGGVGNAFSSDDVKRTIALSLAENGALSAAATGLGRASYKTYDATVLCRVHRRALWLGLVLNRLPLSREVPGDAQPSAARTQKPTPRAAAGGEGAEEEEERKPLASWARRNRKRQGLSGPRDARGETYSWLLFKAKCAACCSR